jgi:glucose/arabinose dehydrogenase
MTRPAGNWLGPAIACLALAALFLGCVVPYSLPPRQPPIPPEYPIILPPGYSIQVYASGLRQPYGLALGPDRQLYVAERGAGRILRLPDRNRDGRADKHELIADGLSSPTSLAFTDEGLMLVATTTRLLRLSQPDETGFYLKHEILVDGFPGGSPDAPLVLWAPHLPAILLSTGSACSSCPAQAFRQGGILRYNPDGSGEELLSGSLAAGGMRLHPESNELWLTARRQPEAVYHLPLARRDPSPDHLPQWATWLPTRSAPLGLEFSTGKRFPPPYDDGLFVALHGSWDHGKPIGFKIIYIPLDEGLPAPVQDFASGWLLEPTGRSWGRPVDLLAGQNGSLYLTDDQQGLIYRIFYLGDD